MVVYTVCMNENYIKCSCGSTDLMFRGRYNGYLDAYACVKCYRSLTTKLPRSRQFAPIVIAPNCCKGCQLHEAGYCSSHQKEVKGYQSCRRFECIVKK